MLGLCCNKKTLFHPSQPGSCAWLSPFFLCDNHTCVLVCVCLYMCVYKCVIKVININKYKQNHDDVICNIEVETEIDVHSDVRFQEREYQFHFTDIQLTLHLFPWSGIIYPPPTLIRTFDRNPFLQSLFRNRNHFGNLYKLCHWNEVVFNLFRTAKFSRRDNLDYFKR